MTSSRTRLARHLRVAGIAARFDADRRREPFGYQVWPGEGVRAPYDVSHDALVRGLTAAYPGPNGDGSGAAVLREVLGELCELGVLRPDGTAGDWAVTGHRGLLAVQDRRDGAGRTTEQPAVYLGPDSLRFVDILLAQDLHGTALEVGCGSGLASCALAVRCGSVTAIDVVPEAVRATGVSSRLNGVADRVRPLRCALEEFTPPGRYSVVAANLPGVPVPPGIRYSPAGDGGPDGLRLIRRLVDRLSELMEPDGTAVMRFQSLTRGGELRFAEDLRRACAAHGWDGLVLVEAWAPASVRAALTATYAGPDNPGRGYPELFAAARGHLIEVGADGFASCSLVLRGAGRGHVVVRDLTGSPGGFGEAVAGRLVADTAAVGREHAAALGASYYARARALPDEFWELGGAGQLAEPLARLDELVTGWSRPQNVAEVTAEVFAALAEKDHARAEAMVLAVRVLADVLLEAGILTPYQKEES
ncbi:50S ribosomal protein L11 methyltransferase [Micromonospora sp. KC721]|uniref:50S ribosomal protein L11 methyltransferase n=1 Tax=Micromonospora sp. KC721 TaxID=2530380 RepID=UPI00104B7228|nr:50S ribosomal protein L11 methyltransferase [Micromonospora sp. KC721]TDB82240.1 hypothetical protein E1182_02090 [Micromonospora sp. KC721]